MDGAREPKLPAAHSPYHPTDSGAWCTTFSACVQCGNDQSDTLLLRPTGVLLPHYGLSRIASASAILSSYDRSFLAIDVTAFHSAHFPMAIPPAIPLEESACLACRLPLCASPAFTTGVSALKARAPPFSRGGAPCLLLPTCDWRFCAENDVRRRDSRGRPVRGPSTALPRGSCMYDGEAPAAPRIRSHGSAWAVG